MRQQINRQRSRATIGSVGDISDTGFDMFPVDGFLSDDQLQQQADQAAAQIAGTDLNTFPVGNTSLVDQLLQAAPQALTFFTAYQLSQINIARAQKGLAPLNTAQYGPQVGVSLSPQTQQLITYGLIGLGVILLLPKLFAR